MTKNQLYTIAGTIWGLVGLFLLVRGIGMYFLAIETQGSSQQAVFISLGAALLIGGVKGKFVLTKTARRNKDRIDNLEPPLKVHHVYAKPFYIFIAVMMGVGFMLRAWNELLGGYVVVAAIYCGIGMALMVSSLVYWKAGPPDKSAVQNTP
ncbi:hypothetical protein [Nitrospina gracilis]|uniref:hypothetical protein n=1 Tax=Nitrospina gracilis TaxID=35801 RepID=UPI001F3410D5|nr:hypothetical protein [Nitrospina gracilis]MCF8720086.1 divalent metal cation (Fe/Co/Zn/Cd) transporter [Nitrospina gracilis Nb-211]